MSEKLREALSAAVDGEASEFELRRVFDEMGKDDDLAQAWQSYHLIKQAVRGENVQGVSTMSERIWASLDAEEFLEQDIVQEEPLSSVSAPAPTRRWGMAGGAVAAALALGVLLSGGFLESDDPSVSGAPGAQLVDNTTSQGLVGPNSDISGPDISDLAEGTTFDPANVLTVSALETVDADAIEPSIASSIDGYDYGPGFVPYSELSPADQARSDGYFLHHVQNQAVNNDNVLSFVKMISYSEQK